jgi:hypothetical protein
MNIAKWVQSTIEGRSQQTPYPRDPSESLLVKYSSGDTELKSLIQHQIDVYLEGIADGSIRNADVVLTVFEFVRAARPAVNKRHLQEIVDSRALCQEIDGYRDLHSRALVAAAAVEALDTEKQLDVEAENGDFLGVMFAIIRDTRPDMLWRTVKPLITHGYWRGAARTLVSGFSRDERVHELWRMANSLSRERIKPVWVEFLAGLRLAGLPQSEILSLSKNLVLTSEQYPSITVALLDVTQGDDLAAAMREVGLDATSVSIHSVPTLNWARKRPQVLVAEGPLWNHTSVELVQTITVKGIGLVEVVGEGLAQQVKPAPALNHRVVTCPSVAHCLRSNWFEYLLEVTMDLGTMLFTNQRPETRCNDLRFEFPVVRVRSGKQELTALSGLFRHSGAGAY